MEFKFVMKSKKELINAMKASKEDIRWEGSTVTFRTDDVMVGARSLILTRFVKFVEKKALNGERGKRSTSLTKTLILQSRNWCKN